MADLAKDIFSEYQKYKDSIYQVRRKIHQNPEVSWAEFDTTKLICSVLEKNKIPYKKFKPTGLMVDIKASGNNKTKAQEKIIALRADLDALAISEPKNRQFVSKKQGFMHACGHDFHCGALLGAVLIVNSLKSHLKQNIRFIFQPSEEAEPSGAKAIIKQGALVGVEQLYALHCDPALEVGTLGVRSGSITSAASHVSVEVKGKGGHTSRPHLTNDIVYALSSLVIESAGVLSRRLDPRTVSSLIWGTISAGEAPNSVAQYGKLEGSFRTMDYNIWKNAKNFLQQMIHEILDSYKFDLKINVAKG
ncbi:MAG: amidohydrolase, partial [Bifidobacteriaceae bacterium]|nr:amidohydrolase [Bifidobacteriaceae bacterium]